MVEEVFGFKAVFSYCAVLERVKIWEAYHSESLSGSHSQYILLIPEQPLEAYCVGGHADMNVIR